MKCPNCELQDSHVIDSRYVSMCECVRRRRECNECGHRFTTYERMEGPELSFVKKRNGRKQAFSRDKLFNSVREACNKRPIANTGIDKMVSNVCRELLDQDKKEPSTDDIASVVMGELMQVDIIACIRYTDINFGSSDIEEYKSNIESVIDIHKEIVGGAR